MLGSHVKRDIFYARARRYGSTREASMAVHNIAGAVFDTVLATVNQNLAPLQQSISLRKSILKLDAVYPWDLYAPLVKEAQIHLPYERALSMVFEGLHVLGSEYVGDLRSGIDDGWVDVYENIGKCSGAYSAWTYGTHPFVLLNYTNTLKDVFTLAHELGHSMHSYYTWKSQPPIYGGYSIFCAEVASTCNEILLMNYLLHSDVSREIKLHLLFHFVDTIRGTVYNQVLFAEFEQTIHRTAEQGEALTAEMMSAVMSELYVRYYGSDFAMDELFAVNWSRIPHFYRSFYVYQYATGLSAAIALANGIIERKDGALTRYLDFLKAGSSKYSLDLLVEAGVDMKSAVPIQSTAELLTNLLLQAEALLAVK